MIDIEYLAKILGLIYCIGGGIHASYRLFDYFVTIKKVEKDVEMMLKAWKNLAIK